MEQEVFNTLSATIQADANVRQQAEAHLKQVLIRLILY